MPRRIQKQKKDFFRIAFPSKESNRSEYRTPYTLSGKVTVRMFEDIKNKKKKVFLPNGASFNCLRF